MPKPLFRPITYGMWGPAIRQARERRAGQSERINKAKERYMNDTPEAANTIETLKSQRNALHERVMFALMHAKGMGEILNTKDYTTQHWIDYFIEALELCGTKVDRDLLMYNRATHKARARMLKDPELAAKVKAKIESKGASS